MGTSAARVYRAHMTKTKNRISAAPIMPDRVRSIGQDGFSFVPNRFVQAGFFAALRHDELQLYLLLVLVGNRQGMSFYHYDSLCSLLHVPIERYLAARNALIDKDLIAFDGTRFQVLELPRSPPPPPQPLRSAEELERDDDATVRAMIERSLHDET